jgi:alkylation response protein AidB-like acyl-CoA dehydrogenase
VNMNLTEDQIDFRDSIIKFATQELNNDLEAKDQAEAFPREEWEKCAEMGILGLPFAEEYGGCAVDLKTTAVSIQALGYACKDSGLVHAVVSHILCGMQIELFGSEEQRKKYLPKICDGSMIGAQAITEADSGSDAFAMKTKAEKKDGGYLINGTKMFISNGPVADIALIFAITDPARKTLGGVSCFILEKGTPGFEECKAMSKMGLRTLQNGELVFVDCMVSAANLLGKEGFGAAMFADVIEIERALLFASHIGTLERVVEVSVKYAKERKQFGQSIGKFQAVSQKIADMKVNLELGRLILYQTISLKQEKKRAIMESSIAKLFISESLKSACLDAVQIHGAYGYMTEFEVERDLRDSIGSTIYSGTSELQRNIIAKLLGL